MCFIQTSTLDGEKNLKPKFALNEIDLLFKNQDKFYENIIFDNFKFGAKEPDQYLYAFEGYLKIKEKTYSFGPKQFLLRGGFLKNTKWIIGVIVYTGNDTKLMRNAEPSKIKISAVEKKTNLFIIGILFFQFLLILTIAINNWNFNNKNKKNLFYLPHTENIEKGAILSYFTYFLLMNTMLPISLIGFFYIYIILTIIKLNFLFNKN